MGEKPTEHEWLPIHYFKRSRSLCWTHYLAKDSSLSSVKCRHCHLILEISPKEQSSTSRFRSHIKHHHRINPDSDYYLGKDHLPMIKGSFSGHTNFSDENLLSSFKMRNKKIVRNTEVDNDLLLAVIVASNDLNPRKFIENESVKLLLSRLSLSLPDIDVVISIEKLSSRIDEIILRTLQLNEDLSSCREFKLNPILKICDIKVMILDRLNTLSQLYFFSLTEKSYAKFQVCNLNFFDSIGNLGHSLLLGYNNNVVYNDGSKQNIYKKYPKLDQYTYSVTKSEENCMVTIVSKCLIKLIGEAITSDININTTHFLDKIIILSKIKITNQLLIDIMKCDVGFDMSLYSNILPSIKKIVRSHHYMKSFSRCDLIGLVQLSQILSEFNKLLYFLTSKGNSWQFGLLSLISLEQDMEFLTKEFNYSSENWSECRFLIQEYIQTISINPLSKLGIFLTPTSFLDQLLLNQVFGSKDLISEITDITLNYLKKYIHPILLPCEPNITSPNIESIDDFFNILKNIIIIELKKYVKYIEPHMKSSIKYFCEQNNYKLVQGDIIKRGSNGSEHLVNKIDLLVDIYYEIYIQFIQNIEIIDKQGPVLRFLYKVIRAQFSSTVTLSQAFLFQYISDDKCASELVENILKIKTLDSEFNLTKIDFDHDNLQTICKYATKSYVI